MLCGQFAIQVFAGRMNRQYKHNLSCTVHIIDVPTDGMSLSVFHRELQNIYWIYHTHRRPYRHNQSVGISQSCETFTEYTTITDVPTEGIRPSVFARGWELFTFYIDAVHNYRRNVNSKARAINASLALCTYRQTYRRTAKILEGYLKILCEIQNFKVNSPMESPTE
jgi:hypothetical protein